MVWNTAGGTDAGWLPSERLRSLRIDAGWSQGRLAAAMARMGYGWSQHTCSDAERGTHPLSAGELVALAALFGVPVVEFFRPDDHTDPVALAESGIGDEYEELLVGAGGVIGSGGPDWQPAKWAAGVDQDDDDYRPAKDYWTARGENQ